MWHEQYDPAGGVSVDAPPFRPSLGSGYAADQGGGFGSALISTGNGYAADDDQGGYAGACANCGAPTVAPDYASASFSFCSIACAEEADRGPPPSITDRYAGDGSALPAKYKTRLCKFSPATCPFIKDGRCLFAHTVEELNIPPGPAPTTNQPPPSSRFKTRLCKYFLAGHCPYTATDTCQFAHSQEELRGPELSRPPGGLLSSAAYAEEAARRHEETELLAQMRAQTAVKLEERKFTKMCKYFLAGHCPFTASGRCQFAHSEAELRPRAARGHQLGDDTDWSAARALRRESADRYALAGRGPEPPIGLTRAVSVDRRPGDLPPRNSLARNSLARPVSAGSLPSAGFDGTPAASFGNAFAAPSFGSTFAPPRPTSLTLPRGEDPASPVPATPPAAYDLARFLPPPGPALQQQAQNQGKTPVPTSLLTRGISAPSFSSAPAPAPIW